MKLTKGQMNGRVYELILLGHLHDNCHKRQRDNGGWLPRMAPADMDYMIDKFMVWMIVACGEDYHRVAIAKNGHLALLDHPDSINEMNRVHAFEELGGDPERMPFCLRAYTLFDIWKTTIDLDGCPSDFYGYVVEQRQIKSYRAIARGNEIIETYTKSYKRSKLGGKKP